MESVSQDDLKRVADGAALVCFADPGAYEAPDARALLMGPLDQHERGRYGRFVFDRDRLTYLVAHALTRAVLARVCAVEPGEFRFEPSPRGRPEIAAPASAVGMRFNLSHTHGLVACAVAQDHAIGVDVERVDRRVEIARVAPSVFSREELAWLFEDFGQPDDVRTRTRFFQLWTLKESYIKATGEGLGAPLKEITFRVAEPCGATVAFANHSDEPGTWRFFQTSIGASHRLALAHRTPSQCRPKLAKFDL